MQAAANGRYWSWKNRELLQRHRCSPSWTDQQWRHRQAIIAFDLACAKPVDDDRTHAVITAWQYMGPVTGTAPGNADAKHYWSPEAEYNGLGHKLLVLRYGIIC